MKHLIVASLTTLAFFAVSCQQKPKEEAQQPATQTQEQQAEQKPKEETKQPNPQTQEQQTQQKPATEEKKAQQEKQPQTIAQAPTVNAEALAKSKGCFACHDINTKKVGPAFKDVAKKEAGNVDKLAQKIKNGGVGEWGNVPMPPQNVTEEEAKLLAQWVLSLK